MRQSGTEHEEQQQQVASFLDVGVYLLHLRNCACARALESGYLIQLGEHGALWRPLFVQDSQPPTISLTKAVRRDPGETKGETVHEALGLFCCAHPESMDFSEWNPTSEKDTPGTHPTSCSESVHYLTVTSTKHTQLNTWVMHFKYVSCIHTSGCTLLLSMLLLMLMPI